MTTFRIAGVASYQGRTDGPFHASFEHGAGKVSGELAVGKANTKGKLELKFPPLPGNDKTAPFRISMGTNVRHVIALTPVALGESELLCRLRIGKGPWLEEQRATLSTHAVKDGALHLKGWFELPFAAFTEAASSQVGQLLFSVGDVTLAFDLKGKKK